MKKIILPFSIILGLAFISNHVIASGFSDHLLGGISPNNFLVYLIYAYIGMLLNLGSDLERRDPSSIYSPQPFMLSYWWKDNKARFLISTLTIPIGILFCKELVGLELSRLSALMIGLGSDRLFEFMKRKNIIKNASDLNK